VAGGPRFTTFWRCDGNPIGRVVNVFLIVFIIANGLAFAAETVNSVYERWGLGVRGVQRPSR
jgi:hypothetical protein